MKHRAFKTREDLEAWLAEHHASETELYVRVFKKASGKPSVVWNDIVLAVLCWGWIDGVKKSLDDESFLQRITPRRPRSIWSKINCDHVERLISEGRMQPAGLAQVTAAKADGRWDAAYGGSTTSVIPDEFFVELKKHPAAAAFFATLKKSSLFLISYRVQTAKKPETRAKRIAAIIDALSRGERPV